MRKVREFFRVLKWALTNRELEAVFFSDTLEHRIEKEIQGSGYNLSIVSVPYKSGKALLNITLIDLKMYPRSEPADKESEILENVGSSAVIVTTIEEIREAYKIEMGAKIKEIEKQFHGSNDKTH